MKLLVCLISAWDSQTKEGNAKADAVKDKFVAKLLTAGVMYHFVDSSVL